MTTKKARAQKFGADVSPEGQPSLFRDMLLTADLKRKGQYGMGLMVDFAISILDKRQWW